MPIVRIDALCECEGCQKRFGIELDMGESLLAGEYVDFDDMVRETIRGGNTTHYTWGVRGKQTVDRLPLSYQPTIQAGLMLCDVCSKKCDELPTEGALTREQIEEALGLFQEI